MMGELDRRVLLRQNNQYLWQQLKLPEIWVKNSQIKKYFWWKKDCKKTYKTPKKKLKSVNFFIRKVEIVCTDYVNKCQLNSLFEELYNQVHIEFNRFFHFQLLKIDLKTHVRSEDINKWKTFLLRRWEFAHYKATICLQIYKEKLLV